MPRTHVPLIADKFRMFRVFGPICVDSVETRQATALAHTIRPMLLSRSPSLWLKMAHAQRAVESDGVGATGVGCNKFHIKIWCYVRKLGK